MVVIMMVSGCLISVAAFLFGVFKLFRKGKPLYFQLLVCAVGCYALGLVEFAVVDTCFPDGGSVIDFPASIAYVGCIAFLITANVFELKHVLKEKYNRKASVPALVAPIVYISLIVWIIVLTISSDPVYGIAMLLYIPGALTCYHNLKHLLLPPDDKGILKSIRGCDIWTLVLIFSANTYSLLYLISDSLAYLIVALFASIASFLLVIYAVKGAKTWETQNYTCS